MDTEDDGASETELLAVLTRLAATGDSGHALRSTCADAALCARLSGRGDAGAALAAIVVLSKSTAASPASPAAMEAWLRSRRVVVGGKPLLCSIAPWRILDTSPLGAGLTLLHNAVMMGNVAMARVLLETPWTPLDASPSESSGSAALCFPVNAQDLFGRTPIAVARDLAMVQLLLGAGADPRIRDHSGALPTEWLRPFSAVERTASDSVRAKAAGYSECIKLMQMRMTDRDRADAASTAGEAAAAERGGYEEHSPPVLCLDRAAPVSPQRVAGVDGGSGYITEGVPAARHTPTPLGTPAATPSRPQRPGGGSELLRAAVAAFASPPPQALTQHSLFSPSRRGGGNHVVAAASGPSSLLSPHDDARRRSRLAASALSLSSPAASPRPGHNPRLPSHSWLASPPLMTRQPGSGWGSISGSYGSPARPQRSDAALDGDGSGSRLSTALGGAPDTAAVPPPPPPVVDTRPQAHYAVLLVDARPPWVVAPFESAAADEAGMPQSSAHGAYQLLHTSWGDLPRLPPRCEARRVCVLEHAYSHAKGSQLKSVQLSQDPVSGLLVAATIGPFTGPGAPLAARHVAAQLRRRLLSDFRARVCLAGCDREPSGEERAAGKFTAPASGAVADYAAGLQEAAAAADAAAALPPVAGPPAPPSARRPRCVAPSLAVDAAVYRYVCPQRLHAAGCEYSAFRALLETVAALKREAPERAKAPGTTARAVTMWRSLDDLLRVPGDMVQLVPAVEGWLKQPRWHTAAPSAPEPINVLLEARNAAAPLELQPASAGVDGLLGELGRMAISLPRTDSCGSVLATARYQRRMGDGTPTAGSLETGTVSRAQDVEL